MNADEKILNFFKENEDHEYTLKSLCEIFSEYKRTTISTTLSFLCNRYQIKHTHGGWVYTKKALVQVVTNSSPGPITVDEINKARRIVQPGMKMIAKNNRKLFQDSDEEPDEITVTVTSKHPRVVMTDKGISFTWAEVAKYLRDRRTAIGE